MYGLISSLCWGTYTITSRILTSDKYQKIQSADAALLMLIGIAVVFLTFFLSRAGGLGWLMKIAGALLMIILSAYVIIALNKTGVAVSPSALAVGALTGALWSAGMISTFFAFSAGAEAAKLTPIYNTNTLIAVFLGIVALHELPAPDAKLKVITGAALIVVGSILVAG